jgi:hypothetical protein
MGLCNSNLSFSCVFMSTKSKCTQFPFGYLMNEHIFLLQATKTFQYKRNFEDEFFRCYGLNSANFDAMLRWGADVAINIQKPQKKKFIKW